MLLVEHGDLVHYPLHDVRTELDRLTFALREQQVVDRFHRHAGIQCDCSQTVQWLCRLAGLADPCGLNYGHAGYTGNLLEHLEHYSDPSAAEVGAIVVLGPGTGDHAVQVHAGGGRDPLVFSQGREIGPVFEPLSRTAAAHRPPVRLLSIAHL